MSPFLVLLAVATPAAEPLPWTANPPVVRVRSEVIRKSPRPGAAALVSAARIGPGLERAEVHAVEVRDDVHSERTRRVSRDNGRTWSAPEPLPSTDVHYEGHELAEVGGPVVYDPASGRLVEMWLRQVPVAGLYHCFTYVRTSADLGRSWIGPRQLRYEPGPDFDPKAPHASAFLNVNEAYFGSGILRLKDGTLVHPVAHANAPGDAKNAARPWKMGSLCFLGRWDPHRKDYDWQAGRRVEISPDDSARGLMEPDAAQLADGRVLVVWRGSNEGWDGTRAKRPGCKFFALSPDGGRTLTAPAEWTYDDGSRFYSPSSYHRLLRHEGNGKLYWVGNISAGPPRGNSPRYPLVIAEVDDRTGLLRKKTVTAIDDRRPGQGPGLQLSNFSLLENPETHDLELTLTRYGEYPDSVYTADCVRYTLTPVRSP